MNYTLDTATQEHLRAIGIPDPPASLECSDPDYDNAFRAWAKSEPGEGTIVLHRKALGHVAWKQHMLGGFAAGMPIADTPMPLQAAAVGVAPLTASSGKTAPAQASPTPSYRGELRTIIGLLILLLLALLLTPRAHAQFSRIYTIQTLNAGSAIGFHSSPFRINCSTNTACTDDGYTLNITASSTAATAFSALTASSNSNLGTFAGSGNTWDFSAAVMLKFRVGAGATTSANGDCAYDSTAKMWHCWQNGADRLLIASTNVGTAGQAFLSGADGSGTFANPACGSLSDSGTLCTSSAALAQTIANVSHKWLNSYTASTGVFTQTQPACGDLSDAGVFCSGSAYSSLTGIPSTFAPSAHNLLSTAHGDTTAASAVRGDIIAAIGVTPTWQRLAHPTVTGGYFKWNGTDIVASTQAASGTGTPTACTNQFITGFTLNADAAPTSTCTTVPYAAVSGTPTLFYQTFKDNGTARTQRPTVNLISGTNATVTCADNSGSNQTDCTIAATAGSGATIAATPNVIKGDGAGNGVASGITDNGTTVGTTEAVDFTGGSSTRPIKAGTAASTPGSCTANKDLYIKTDATAGQQLFICNSSGNGFNLVGDGGGGGGMTNPMTTTGDIIYSSDNSGTPARLAIGGANTLLHGGTTPAYSAVVQGDVTNGYVDQSSNQASIAGNKTFTGNTTATAGQNQINAYRINNVLFVDGVKYACSAAGFNSAITDAGSGDIVDATGCPTITGQSTTVTIGGTSVQITFRMPGATYSGTANPLFMLDPRSTMVMNSNTVVTQTNSSANAVILAGANTSAKNFSGGIEGNGAITCSSTTSTIGLVVGGSSDTGNLTTNSANYIHIGPITITGCATGEKYGNNVYVISHEHTIIDANVQQILVPSGLTNTGEGVNYLGGLIGVEAGTFAQTCFDIQSYMEIHLYGTSITQCGIQIGGTNTEFDCQSCRFEDPNGSTALPYVATATTGTNFRIMFHGGLMLEDSASSRTEFIKDSSTVSNHGGTIDIFGLTVVPAETLAQVVNTAGTCCSVVMVMGLHNGNGGSSYTNAVGGSWFAKTVFDTYQNDLLTRPLTVAAPTATTTSINFPTGTAPTTPNAGDVWLDSNEEKHYVQASTNGFFKYYDSGGSNYRKDDTSGTITTHTVHHPLAPPTVASFERTDACSSATCTETWQPSPTVLMVTADFTTAANTSLQAITGLTFTMPANLALKAQFDCDILYNQNTAAVADAFGIQDVSVAPTNIMASGFVQTAATTWVDANLPTLTTTTATNIATMTPSAITTVWHARIRAMVEQPSNASTSVVQIMIKTGTSADTLTVKRGSNCSVNFQ